MSTQATLGEIESTEPESEPASETTGSELRTTADVSEGDKIALDRRAFDPDSLYTVVNVTAGSIELERGDSQTVIRQFKNEWRVRNSTLTVEPFKIATRDFPPINCHECGAYVDPAEIVHRVGYTYTCNNCE